MKAKTKTAEELQPSEVFTLQDLELTDKMVFLNSSDNTEQYINSILANPANKKEALTPNAAYEIVDGKLAMDIRGCKNYVALLYDDYYEPVTKQQFKINAKLIALDKEQFEKSEMTDNGCGGKKVVVLHNPNKQSFILTGEAVMYEVKKEVKEAQVYNGTKVYTKKFIETVEYFKIYNS